MRIEVRGGGEKGMRQFGGENYRKSTSRTHWLTLALGPFTLKTHECMGHQENYTRITPTVHD
jgi:hypothetical protein